MHRANSRMVLVETGHASALPFKGMGTVGMTDIAEKQGPNRFSKAAASVMAGLMAVAIAAGCTPNRVKAPAWPTLSTRQLNDRFSIPPSQLRTRSRAPRNVYRQELTFSVRDDVSGRGFDGNGVVVVRPRVASTIDLAVEMSLVTSPMAALRTRESLRFAASERRSTRLSIPRSTSSRVNSTSSGPASWASSAPRLGTLA